MRLPDEDHQDMYSRLLIVADDFRLIGATHINDSWIKEKYIECMMPYVPIDVKTLVGRECYSSLSSQDAVHEMQALKVLEQNSHDSLNRAIGMSKGNNLALVVNPLDEVHPQEQYRASWSMSYPEDLECHYHDHMAFHAKSFWVDPSKAKEDNIKRNHKSGFTSFGPKTRSCYNCDDKRHFIAECPYENRELHNGRLIPKDKSKESKGKYSKAPNKKFYNNKTKKGKRHPKVVLVTREEYSSDEVESSSDDEEGSSKEMAAIVTTNIPSSSLFESPNENPHIKNAHCFMATSSLDTSIVLSTQEEYSSGDDEVDDEEDATSNGLVALASLSTNSSSPSESPNEIIHVEEESCLMAKSSEVSSPSPSMPNISSDLGIDDASLKVKQEMLEFDEFLLNLQDQAHEVEHSQVIEEAQIEGQDGDPNDQVDQVTPPRPRKTKEEIEARRLARRDRILEIRGHTHDKVLGDVRAKVSTRRQLANFSNHHAYISVVEPKKVFEALEDSDWVDAMHEELNNFKRNKVWTLVEKPKECRNVIGTKWIFKNKQDEFGNIVRNKARLVAQGGASRGGRRRPRHDRSSDEFASNAPRKSVTSRRKNKEVRENYKTMDPISYSAIRQKNWYDDVPRDEDIAGRRYWCAEQEFIFMDIYEPMKNRDPCKLSMWTFWRSTITLKMLSGKDEENTMEWMTGSTHCSATLRQFAGVLGVPVDGGRRLHGPQQTDKNALVHLYTSAGKIGQAKGLLPIYSQLLRFFRATICPSGGNNDALRGTLVDLMHLSYKCARDGNEEQDYTLDIMDFIFHEIHDAMVSRTTIPYAPYIQLLINNSLLRFHGVNLMTAFKGPTPLAAPRMHDAMRMRMKRKRESDDDYASE
ncbi:hypothetical protein QYE76_030369 [Lolium multiflorum]|uniref:Reverse transcriptase Ty1/copia-type domain-containing protein n=1 Tax=Lolium multiflorum TaxID=4521 RepID=A0AAD8VIQ9_LOLMU|nr:hypothetical protein QYE76_030369 [Lolium multiflorum]